MTTTPYAHLTRRRRRRPAWLAALGVALLLAGEALRAAYRTFLAGDRWIGVVLALIGGYLGWHIVLMWGGR